MLSLLFLNACTPKHYQWVHEQSIPLKDIGPIGVVPDSENSQHLWVSDSDNNRVVKMDMEGSILVEHKDMARPMHIVQYEGKLYVPEYSSDTISVIQPDNKISTQTIPEQPDAPAGIDVTANQIAVADFYNHRIIYQNGDKNQTFGKKGKGKGEFHYPTDLQFVGDKLYIADAYNNRIQVFDLDGNHLQTIGEGDGMNAATGIYVSETQLLVTDFENSRILAYDLEKGELQQLIEQHLDKPTDVFVKENTLYVTNYHSKDISIFKWKKVSIEKAKDKTGKEYTAAYICPMHCKGSGSDKAGTCPVCKMDYVKNK